MLRGFDRIRALDEGALRALLEGTDARDRLWAIWALALKGGPRALVDHLAEEPSAGVRRHMCIVLAGGELDLLVAMARFDPDTGVRATASGLVTRLAGGGRLPWSIALERLDDPAARVAVLSELTPLAPPALVEAALRLARGDEPEVALEAMSAILRIAPASAPTVLADALQRANEQGAYAILSLWTKHAAASAVHEALRAAPIEARLAAVRHYAAHWSDVAAVALDADVRVRSVIREAFFSRLPVVPIEALAAWLEDDAERSSYFANAILERLLRGEALPSGTGVLAYARRKLALLPASPASPASPAEEPSLALVNAYRNEWDDEDDERYDERACLVLLIETIERLT